MTVPDAPLARLPLHVCTTMVARPHGFSIASPISIVGPEKLSEYHTSSMNVRFVRVAAAVVCFMKLSTFRITVVKAFDMTLLIVIILTVTRYLVPDTWHVSRHGVRGSRSCSMQCASLVVPLTQKQRNLTAFQNTRQQGHQNIVSTSTAANSRGVATKQVPRVIPCKFARPVLYEGAGLVGITYRQVSQSMIQAMINRTQQTERYTGI